MSNIANARAQLRSLKSTELASGRRLVNLFGRLSVNKQFSLLELAELLEPMSPDAAADLIEMADRFVRADQHRRDLLLDNARLRAIATDVESANQAPPAPALRAVKG